MSDYHYLNFSIKFEKQPEELLPAFIRGAIIQSLTTVFGEIGGQTQLDLLHFDEDNQKGILRVPTNFVAKTRTALCLIHQFQGISAIFQVICLSTQLPSLVDTFIDI